MKIYTRTGDKGETSLRWGERVAKDALRVEAYGTVDEANCCIGLALAQLKAVPVPGLRTAADGRGQTVVEIKLPDRDPHGDPHLKALLLVQEVLVRVQRELFDVGADLATPPDRSKGEQPKVHEMMVGQLERDIDAMEAFLQPLRNFILPGGAPVSAALHLARAVARRAERRLVTLSRSEEVDQVLVRYLNRLSDLLFVAARTVNHALGVPDPVVVFKK